MTSRWSNNCNYVGGNCVTWLQNCLKSIEGRPPGEHPIAEGPVGPAPTWRGRYWRAEAVIWCRHDRGGSRIPKCGESGLLVRGARSLDRVHGGDEKKLIFLTAKYRLGAICVSNFFTLISLQWWGTVFFSTSLFIVHQTSMQEKKWLYQSRKKL